MKTFKEIENYLLNHTNKKIVALAGSHDIYALDAIIKAKQNNLIDVVLIGDKEKTIDILKSLNEDPKQYEIINILDEAEQAKYAVHLVKTNKAHIPMKGLIQTSHFMRSILDKQSGLLDEGHILNQMTLFEDKLNKKLVGITDCAININPGFKDKIKIINNGTMLFHKIGINKPKIALLSAVEIPTPKIPSTTLAVELTDYYKDFNDRIVYGPLALDNAISVEAANHKGIKNAVAGLADILVVPDLWTGNIFTKALLFYTDFPMAGVILGTKTPVIAASRTDTALNKYNSILMGLMLL